MTPESGPAPAPERRYALESSETPLFSKPEPPEATVPEPTLPIVDPRGAGLPPEVYEARVTVVAALREEGYTFRQISKALGMSNSSVEWCARKARERGRLRAGIAEAVQMLDDAAVPLAVDALMRKLRKGEDTAVFKVLEGRGLLKNYSQVRSEGDAKPGNMAFQFVFNGGPAGESGVTIEAVPKGLPGVVVGVAREDETD